MRMKVDLGLTRHCRIHLPYTYEPVDELLNSRHSLAMCQVIPYYLLYYYI